MGIKLFICSVTSEEEKNEWLRTKPESKGWHYEAEEQGTVKKWWRILEVPDK